MGVSRNLSIFDKSKFLNQTNFIRFFLKKRTIMERKKKIVFIYFLVQTHLNNFKLLLS